MAYIKREGDEMKFIKLLCLILVLTMSMLVSSYAHTNATSYEVSDKLIGDLKTAEELLVLDQLASDLTEQLKELKEHDDYSIQQFNEGDIAYPAEIPHHTCGYGGSSCRTCYRTTQVNWCGCVLQAYRCCCGAYMGGNITYCSDHP